MEILLPVGVVVLLIWLIARIRRGAQEAPGHVHKPSPVPPATTPTSLSRSVRSVSESDCWVPPNKETTVSGFLIKGGMMYVGEGLASVSGSTFEHALINPALPVNRSRPNRSGTGMGYWPSYALITPESRAAYLEWLASGRRDPAACIGYVFLYFYGLERRALAEARHSDQAKAELPAIVDEVDQLLRIYSDNRSFRGYARQFLDVVELVSAPGRGEITPPMERTGYELPLALRVGIGRIVAAGGPLPADWALSWYLTDPENSLKTAVRRCPKEFNDLFRARYTREFGDGLKLKDIKTRLQVEITPASASFGGRGELRLDLPDIAAMAPPRAKLRQVGEGCSVDLDAFSRWVGRNPAALRTVGAVALLPPELVTTQESGETQGLWNWVERTIGSQARTVCATDGLLEHCSSFGTGKLAKSEAVLLAQLLEKGGYGIEPDVRFGGATLAPGSPAVLFRLQPGARPIATPQFAAATVLLHLTVAVSAADGSISQSERDHLEAHMRHSLNLSEAERWRLSAHLDWLMKMPPSLAGLKKRLEPLDQRQRTAIADFVIGVAGADGQISPEEIRTLGKLYPLLGLAADDVYSHVHAMTAGGAIAAPADEPVTVVPGHPPTGFAIPKSPTATGAVTLNMAAVEAKLAESSRISAILDDIFTEDDEPSIPASPAPGTAAGKLRNEYAVLLTKLLERPEWSRLELESIATEHRLLVDGAIDTLNETAFEHCGGPVLEGDDPIQVDAATAKELLK